MENPSQSFFILYKDHLVIVGWFLIVCGWLFSNYQQNKIEKRKETRAEIDSICKNASDLMLLCKDYYCNPIDEGDLSKSSKIAFEVYRIVSRVERLNKRNKNLDGHPFSSAKKSCEIFFDSITRDPFTSATREKMVLNSEFILGIEEATHQLMDNLEEGFSMSFSFFCKD